MVGIQSEPTFVLLLTQKRLTHAPFQKLDIDVFLMGVKDINTLEIYIRLSRPGLLIGKGGSCIDYIKEKMEEELNLKIEFILDEPQTFLL